MLRKLRRMRQNPFLAVQYAINNPKAVGLVVLALVAVVALLVASLAMGLFPEWIAVLAVAVIVGYAAWRQYGRVSLLFGASEVAAGAVSQGSTTGEVVKVSGTARAAAPDDGVTPRGRDDDGTYLAYRYEEKVDRDPGGGDDFADEIQDTSTSEETAAVPIYVEDDTGSVLVDTNNADIELAWDEKSRGHRRNTYWAALEEGDQVTVYGTALAPAQRDPPGMIDSVSDVMDAGRGIDFEEYAEGEAAVVTKSAADPYLVVSDRSGLSLMGRQVLWLLLAAGATVALVLLAVADLAGIVPL